jgi:hypothetical protein
MSTRFRVRFLSLTLVAMLALALAAPLVWAQEATETPEAGAEQVSATSPIVGEASVILLAGVARRDFSFTLPDDFDTFERGQFRFLFEDEADYAEAAWKPLSKQPWLQLKNRGWTPRKR